MTKIGVESAECGDGAGVSEPFGGSESGAGGSVGGKSFLLVAGKFEFEA